MPLATVGSPSMQSSSPTSVNKVRSLFKLKKLSPRSSPSPSPIIPALSARRPTLINSQTPAWELPQSWDEWNEMYAAGLIEVDGPPLPPSPCSATFQQPIASDTLFFHPSPSQSMHVKRSSRPISSSFGLHASKSGRPLSSQSFKGYGRNPELQEIHTPLKKLTLECHKRFGSSGVGVLVLDEGVFFQVAEVGRGITHLKKEATLSKHTMLRAQAGQYSPFVVLNLAQERQGSHSRTKGFYAGAPITIPSFDDPNILVTVGIFCLFEELPRISFGPAERDELQEFARKAGSEIVKWQDAKEAKEASRVTDMRKTSWDDSSCDEEEQLFGALLTAEDDSDSQKGSPREEGPADDDEECEPLTTTIPPAACRKQRGSLSRGPNVHARQASNLPEKVRNVLDLSTQLLSDSLSLDFCYVASISASSGSPGACNSPSLSGYSPSSPLMSPRPSAPSPITLLSTHNLPSSAPVFSHNLHTSLLASRSPSLIFNAENPSTLLSDEFTTGILYRIDECHVLAGFSTDPLRHFGKEDMAFIKHFAKDLRKWTEPICCTL
ncbi:hypothetical protein T439DRAFT_384334 [Meredithblackwellia eburnea MCA 4105]